MLQIKVMGIWNCQVIKIVLVNRFSTVVYMSCALSTYTNMYTVCYWNLELLQPLLVQVSPLPTLHCTSLSSFHVSSGCSAIFFFIASTLEVWSTRKSLSELNCFSYCTTSSSTSSFCGGCHYINTSHVVSKCMHESVPTHPLPHNNYTYMYRYSVIQLTRVLVQTYLSTTTKLSSRHQTYGDPI